MTKYESDDIICLDGWCNAEKTTRVNNTFSTSVPKNPKSRQCCKYCPEGEICPSRCKVYNKPCSSMEEFKNTAYENHEFYRKDGIVSKFYIPDDGTRWWVVHTESIAGTEINLISPTLTSEDSALSWMDKYKTCRRVYMIKGKLTDIKENSV